MRRFVAGLVAAIVVVAAVLAVADYLRSADPVLVLTLEQLDGEVSVTRDGRALDARAGLVLDTRDQLSTGELGEAVLGLGDETRIRVGPTSSLQVRSVDEEGVRLELEGGRIEATVRPESGSVRVVNAGREVVATNADFKVGADGGVLQVESIRGDVALSGADQTVVPQGKQVTVVDRYAALGDVPEELLLEVAWPEAKRTRAAVSVVEGRTAAGAEVTVTGAFPEVTVRADTEGRFQAEVRLEEGDNEVDVVAVDPLGRKSEVLVGTLQVRDTKGPRWKGGVTYEE
jgi:hypothetical protein